jgi:hypothetical protein
LLWPVDGVDAVVVAVPGDGAGEGEAVLLGYSAGGDVFWTDHGNDVVDFMIAGERGEDIVEDGAGGFSGVALALVIAMDVVADFEFADALDVLADWAAVTRELAGILEDDTEETGSCGITGNLAVNPLFDFGGCEGVGVKAHGFFVAEDGV